MPPIKYSKKTGGVIVGSDFHERLYVPLGLILIVAIFVSSYIFISSSNARKAEAALFKNFMGGKYKDAAAEGRAILNKNPSNLPVAKITAKSYIRLGAMGTAEREKNVNAAISALLVPLKKYPTDTELIGILSYAYYTKGLDRPAQSFAQKALSLSKGKESTAWTVLAHIDEARSDPARAAFDYEQALKADPKNGEAAVGQVNIKLRQNKITPPNAIKALEKLASTSDVYVAALAHQNIGWVNMGINTAASRSKAMSEFVIALKLVPGLVPSMAGYGILFGQKIADGSPANYATEAANELLLRGKMIIASDKNYPYGYAVLAEAYRINKDNDNYKKYAAMTLDLSDRNFSIPSEEKQAVNVRYGGEKPAEKLAAKVPAPAKTAAPAKK